MDISNFCFLFTSFNCLFVLDDTYFFIYTTDLNGILLFFMVTTPAMLPYYHLSFSFAPSLSLSLTSVEEKSDAHHDWQNGSAANWSWKSPEKLKWTFFQSLSNCYIHGEEWTFELIVIVSKIVSEHFNLWLQHCHMCQSLCNDS